MTRRTKRFKANPYGLSEEAQAMLLRNSELSRIEPVFRRSKHHDEAVLDELHKAGIFRAYRRNPLNPIALSEIGVDRARGIRRERLALEPKDFVD
jgi:hypothetical protein